MPSRDTGIVTWRLALALLVLLGLAGCQGGSRSPYDRGCEFDPYCIGGHGG